MPLMHSKTPKAFKHNVEAEIHAGKPQKQAVAIAYSEKRRAEHHKMGHGGMVEDCPLCSKRPPAENQHEAGEKSDNPMAGYADGGEVKGKTIGDIIGYPQGASLHEGGEVEGDGDMDVESELGDLLGDELMSCMERKDKQGLMACLEAIVHSIRAKE